MSSSIRLSSRTQLRLPICPARGAPAGVAAVEIGVISTTLRTVMSTVKGIRPLRTGKVNVPETAPEALPDGLRHERLARRAAA